MRRLDKPRRAIAGAAAIIVGLASLPALAAPPDDATARAEQLFKQGRQAYMHGDYQRAVDAQHQAWQITQSFDIAANLGQAELKIEHYRDAATHLAYALDHFPPSAKADARARLKQTFEQARAKVSALSLTVQPERADVRIDGKPAPTPLPDPLFLDPGPHKITASLPGYVADARDVTSVAGDTQQIAITLKAQSAAAPSPAPAPITTAPAASPTSAPPTSAPPADSGGPSAKTIVVVTGAGLTVIALGAGLVYKLKASASDNDASNTRAGLEHQYGAQACVSPITAGARAGCAALGQLLDDRDSANQTATIAFVAGGVLAATTIGALVLWPKPSARTAGFMLIPDVGPHGGALHLSGSF